jgi:hypothetical protein
MATKGTQNYKKIYLITIFKKNERKRGKYFNLVQLID